MSELEDCLRQLSQNETFSHLDRFYRFYGDLHGYFSTVICVIGVVCNMLNLAILSKMNDQTATTFFLCMIAFADLVKMIVYPMFGVHFYITGHTTASSADNRFTDTYEWLTFGLISQSIVSIMQSFSTWLHVVLAAYRIRYMQGKCEYLSNIVRAIICSILFILVVCAHGPNILFIKQVSYAGEQKQNLEILIRRLYQCLQSTNKRKILETFYDNQMQTINNTQMFTFAIAQEYKTLKTAQTWFIVLYCHIIPLTLMAVSILALIQTLRKKRRLMKTLYNSTLVRSTCGKSRTSWAFSSRQRTTRGSESQSNFAVKRAKMRLRENRRCVTLLTAIIMITIITELPNTVLVISGDINVENDINTYQKIGDLFDLFALGNNAINFLIYCYMQSKFRNTLLQYFKSVCRLRLPALTKRTSVIKHFQPQNLSIIPEHATDPKNTQMSVPILTITEAGDTAPDENTLLNMSKLPASRSGKTLENRSSLVSVLSRDKRSKSSTAIERQMEICDNWFLDSVSESDESDENAECGVGALVRATSFLQEPLITIAGPEHKLQRKRTYSDVGNRPITRKSSRKSPKNTLVPNSDNMIVTMNEI